MKKPTVSLVLGGGHSIECASRRFCKAVVYHCNCDDDNSSCAYDRAYCRRASNSWLFLSDAGSHSEVYNENSNINPKRFKELMMNTGELVMDVGTVLDGKSAVNEGPIDQLGGLSDAIACLYKIIEKERPKTDENKDEKSGDALKNKDANIKKKNRLHAKSVSGDLHEKKFSISGSKYSKGNRKHHGSEKNGG